MKDMMIGIGLGIIVMGGILIIVKGWPL